jgi:hypothetical protein
VVQPRLLARALLASLAGLLTTPACGGGGGDSFCWPSYAYPAGIEAGPVVARPTPNAVTIAFWSTSSAIGGVEFGPDATYGSGVYDAVPATAHALVLPGLDAASTVHYRVLLDGAPAGGDHAFRTPNPSPGASVRFVVVGDTGTGCAEAAAVIARAAAQDPDFVLLAGDAAYKKGRPDEVRARFTIPFADLAATTPVFAALGNHDVDTDGGLPLLSAQVLPASPAVPAGAWFAFDWGPCHVVGLDSNRPTGPGTAQGYWLASDLAAHPAPWRFAFFHHPVYSSSNHGSTPALQADLVPVFDAAGLDAAFSGHDHDYERTFPMKAGLPVDAGEDPDYADPAGTVYVVTGGGGHGLDDAGTSAFTARSLSAHHVLLVEVTGTTSLALTAIGTDGTVLDHATVTKGP